MFHELDIVSDNLPVVLLHLPEYTNHEAGLGRREKAQGLFDALSHPLFNFTATFFCDFFCCGLCHKQESLGFQRGTGHRRPGFDERDVHTAVAHPVSCHSTRVGGILGG